MKNFPKRIITIMIAVVMTAGLAAGLSACGGTDGGSQDIQSTAPSSDTNSTTSNDSAVPSQQNSSSGSGSNGDIGMDAVISIVLERVPGATKNDIDELECEYDDGRIEYEGELEYNGYEYEFEIDGATGNILKWEIDD